MKIYLAAPYTSKKPQLVDLRVKAINKTAALFMRQKHLVYSPISHCHAIAIDNDLPTDAEYWRIQNESFIDWCEIITILTLPSWQNSLGVKAEIAYGKKKNKKICFYPYPNYTDNTFLPLESNNFHHMEKFLNLCKELAKDSNITKTNKRKSETNNKESK